MPARADLLAVCRAWEQRVGKERVHVVLDPAAVPGWSANGGPWPARPTLPGEAGELARRVGSVLGLLVLPDAREALLTTRLRPRVEAASAARLPGRAARRTPGHRDWVESAAERMREGIRRAGYAVHGDLDALVPRWPDRPRTRAHAGPSPQATLDLAVRVLLDDTDPTRRGGRRDQEGHPPRRHPQDRYVVPPGRALQQPRRSPSTASSTPPTGSTRTSWPPST